MKLLYKQILVPEWCDEPFYGNYLHDLNCEITNIFHYGVKPYETT